MGDQRPSRGLRLPCQVHRLPGGPPLPALSPKGIPDEAAEEGEEREGDLHLHRQEAGAPGPDRESKAADLPEGLRQPAGAQRRQPPACLQDQALVLLETFTTLPDEELMVSLPPFLRVKRNTTGDPAFSMYNLSLRSDWADSADQFCHRLQLSSDDESDEEAVYDVKKASARLKAGTSESESVESF